jgi:acyl-CoA synthetase (AMP-forming)/AMP-acid ligase II
MKCSSPNVHAAFSDGADFRTAAWLDGIATWPEELEPVEPTLLHALASAAKQPLTLGITLVGDDGQSEEHRSYRQLYHQARAAAAAFERLGVRNGDRVLLVLPTSFEFVISFFGVQLLGAVPVPSYPPSGLRVEAGLARLAHISNHCGARVCLTSRQIRPFLGELAARASALEEVLAVEDVLLPDSEAAPSARPRVLTDDQAFIQYTSGSTDRPKGVLLLHRNLVANMHAIGQSLRITRDDVVVSWLPLYHDMGLIGKLLFAIYWQVPLVLMSPTTFLMRPSRWLWAIHRHRGTLASAPNFAYALCTRRVKPAERDGLDLSSWRMALNGAEPVDYNTVQSFADTYAAHGFDGRAMRPVYGMAELSLAATFPRSERPKHLTLNRAELARGRAVPDASAGATAVVSVGKAVPGHAVRVVDERGRDVGDHQVGDILVTGPSLMPGYFGDPKTSAKVLRDGWLWTGDLGFIADGELYVTGRAKDMIILRGRNLYAEDLERAAERVDGARPGGTIAFGVFDAATGTEKVVLLVETVVREEADKRDLARRITERVIERCDVRLDEVVAVARGTLPRTSSGKKQRSQARRLYIKGELHTPSTSPLALAMVYTRSRSGYILAAARKLLKRQGWARALGA